MQVEREAFRWVFDGGFAAADAVVAAEGVAAIADGAAAAVGVDVADIAVVAAAAVAFADLVLAVLAAAEDVVLGKPQEALGCLPVAATL